VPYDEKALEYCCASGTTRPAASCAPSTRATSSSSMLDIRAAYQNTHPRSPGAESTAPPRRTLSTGCLLARPIGAGRQTAPFFLRSPPPGRNAVITLSGLRSAASFQVSRCLRSEEKTLCRKIVTVDQMRAIEKATDASGHTYADMMDLAGAPFAGSRAGIARRRGRAARRDPGRPRQQRRRRFWSPGACCAKPATGVTVEAILLQPRDPKKDAVFAAAQHAGVGDG